MGALEVTLVYSKNVKKMQVFKAFLKISCKEFYNFEQKMNFLIKNDFFTKDKNDFFTKCFFYMLYQADSDAIYAI